MASLSTVGSLTFGKRTYNLPTQPKSYHTAYLILNEANPGETPVTRVTLNLFKNTSGEVTHEGLTPICSVSLDPARVEKWPYETSFDLLWCLSRIPQKNPLLPALESLLESAAIKPTEEEISKLRVAVQVADATTRSRQFIQIDRRVFFEDGSDIGSSLIYAMSSQAFPKLSFPGSVAKSQPYQPISTCAFRLYRDIAPELKPITWKVTFTVFPHFSKDDDHARKTAELDLFQISEKGHSQQKQIRLPLKSKTARSDVITLTTHPDKFLVVQPRLRKRDPVCKNNLGTRTNKLASGFSAEGPGTYSIHVCLGKENGHTKVTWKHDEGCTRRELQAMPKSAEARVEADNSMMSQESIMSSLACPARKIDAESDDESVNEFVLIESFEKPI